MSPRSLRLWRTVTILAWVCWWQLFVLAGCQQKGPDAPDALLETPIEPARTDVKAGSNASSEHDAKAGKSFLWQVTSPTATVYLLGSIHVAKHDVYPLAPAIEQAFDDSSTLVLELHLTPEVQREVATKSAKLGVYPEGDSVERHLDTEAWTRYSQYLQAHGQDPAAFARMKPWLASIALLMDTLNRAGFSGNQGIDRYFQGKAESANKPIESLETVDEQLGLFAELDDKTQELMLLEFLDTEGEVTNQMDQAFMAWSVGDAAGIEQLLLASFTRDEYAPLYQKMFVERNQRMAHKVREYLQGAGTRFVVVGSGHLVGDQGVVQLLANEREVRQL